MIRKPRQRLQTLVVVLAGRLNRRPYCVGILFFIEELSIFFERSKKTKQRKARVAGYKTGSFRISFLIWRI